MKTKRSQEEIVGFLVIILLVAVVAVIFLGISLRKTPEMTRSPEISDFIFSSLLYTVGCENYPQIENFRDLIISCYRNEMCGSETGCGKTKELARELIENSLRIGPELKYRAYTFKIFSENDTFVYITEGNASKSSEGSTVSIMTSQETVNISLRLYY